MNEVETGRTGQHIRTYSGKPENKTGISLVEQGHGTTADPRQSNNVFLEQGMRFNNLMRLDSGCISKRIEVRN